MSSGQKSAKKNQFGYYCGSCYVAINSYTKLILQDEDDTQHRYAWICIVWNALCRHAGVQDARVPHVGVQKTCRFFSVKNLLLVSSNTSM
jgi:hypothetical protein